MSIKSSGKLEKSRYEIVFELTGDEFQNELNKVYKKKKSQISVPGFRKGKASRNFIEKVYGSTVFYQDAIENAYQQEMQKAVDELNITIVGSDISVDIIKSDESGLEFKVEMTVKPEIELGEYKGIEINVEPVEVTDEELEKGLLKLRQQYARIVPVEDRSVEDGDTVVIDFKGFVDGEPFDGGEAENYSLDIGSGTFISGFEEQLIGHNTDDCFDVMVTFPEDYHSEKLAGKEAKFEVFLHEVKQKELPVFDDEFVKDISEFENVESYMEDFKNQLQAEKEKKSEENIKGQLKEKIANLVEGYIPEVMFNEQVNQKIEDLKYGLEGYGIKLSQYLKSLGMTSQDLKAEIRPEAEKNVKYNLALEKIIELENIEVTENDFENEILKTASDYNMSVEQVRNKVVPDALKYKISLDKALAVVRENAVITD